MLTFPPTFDHINLAVSFINSIPAGALVKSTEDATQTLVEKGEIHPRLIEASFLQFVGSIFKLLRFGKNGRWLGLFRKERRIFQSSADDGGAGFMPACHLPFLPASVEALGPTSTPRANSRKYVSQNTYFLFIYFF